MDGITDQMRQYERSSEEIMKSRPKHNRAEGVKRPDSPNIIAVLAGLFVIFIAVAEITH